MPTNGMTIDGLNTVSSLTAQDEVPVWDKEASGEPTRKITAQNMANSVKSLASLPNTTEMNTAIAQSTADKAHFGVIANGTDLNTILTTGLYQSPGAVASISTLINCPVTVPFIMIVRGENGTSGCIQMIASEGVIYTRRGITSGLGSWYRFAGTVVS